MISTIKCTSLSRQKVTEGLFGFVLVANVYRDIFKRLQTFQLKQIKNPVRLNLNRINATKISPFKSMLHQVQNNCGSCD